MSQMKPMSNFGRLGTTTDVPSDAELDDLDRTIIRRLQFNGREPIALIARELGQDRRTISRRIDRLLDSGIIRFATVTDPRNLGYKSMALVCLALKGGADPLAVYEQICTFPEVDYVTLTTGRFSIQAEVMGRDDVALSEVLSARFNKMPEVQSMDVLYYLRIHFQRAWFGNEGESKRTHGIQPLETDEVDRKMVTRLASDPRITFKALAKHLGVSESLARKRYEALLEANVMRVITIANPLHIGFGVTCWVAITMTPNGKFSQVAGALTEIREVSYVAITAGSIDLMVEIVCQSHEHLISLIDENVKQVAGVERAEIWMYLNLEYKPILPL